MSNYYLEYMLTGGQLTDIRYYHRHCAPPELVALGGHPAPEWPDHTVGCHGCDEIIHWAGDIEALTLDGDVVCNTHLGYANDYRTEHWTVGGDPAHCQICEDDRVIARAEGAAR